MRGRIKKCVSVEFEQRFCHVVFGKKNDINSKSMLCLFIGYLLNCILEGQREINEWIERVVIIV